MTQTTDAGSAGSEAVDTGPGDTGPVDTERWTKDFDHFDAAYAAQAPAIWKAIRESGCPVAHSPANRGMWVPTTHADVEAVARDTKHFSSRSPLVAKFGSLADLGLSVPPISSDPPYHTGFRQMLLPFFAPRRIDALGPGVIAHTDSLIDAFVGRCDAAGEFAKPIPVRVIAAMLGVDVEDGAAAGDDTMTREERIALRGIDIPEDLPDADVHVAGADEGGFGSRVANLLEFGPVDMMAAAPGFIWFVQYFGLEIERRRTEPGDDLISFLLSVELDGRALTQDEIWGACMLLLFAGIDTTWSAISASLWHLATHPDDQARMRNEPELWPTAIEELLRAYAPVTMAREVRADVEVAGCPMKAGDPLLLPFPSANRDPAAFDDPDTVHLDRTANRHLSFGAGIHRCLGSNLARMELTVALERFLARVPTFELDPDADPGVRWSAGQIRGLRSLPLRWA